MTQTLPNYESAVTQQQLLLPTSSSLGLENESQLNWYVPFVTKCKQLKKRDQGDFTVEKYEVAVICLQVTMLWDKIATFWYYHCDCIICNITSADCVIKDSCSCCMINLYFVFFFCLNRHLLYFFFNTKFFF